MKILGLNLIGRNHYDPKSAVVLAKHRYINPYLIPAREIPIKRNVPGPEGSVYFFHETLICVTKQCCTMSVYHTCINYARL